MKGIKRFVAVLLCLMLCCGSLFETALADDPALRGDNNSKSIDDYTTAQVHFSCCPVFMNFFVYSYTGELILSADDGNYYLEPGDYYYTAGYEGFEPKMSEFSIKKGIKDMNIQIVLEECEHEDGYVPDFSTGEYEQAEIDAENQTNSTTTPRGVDMATVQQRLNYLINKLANDEKFFTVNQKSCTSSPVSGHGCSNCSVKNVVKQGWLNNLVGLVPNDEAVKNGALKLTYFYNVGPGDGGMSCYGFANFAEWFIYAQLPSDVVTSRLVAKGSFNKNTLSQAQPGDIVRLSKDTGTSGHSGIIISISDTGVTLLDCNGTWYGDKSSGNCFVYARREFKYSDAYKYVAISRATNFVNAAPNTPYIYNSISHYPSGNLKQGKGFSLEGVILSSHPITLVVGAILDSNHNALDNFIYHKAYNINDDKRVYNLKKDGMDAAIKFGNLPVGNYLFACYAVNSEGLDGEVFLSSFTITNDTGSPYISVSGGNAPPNQMQQGKSFSLAGVINSSHTLTNVSAQVINTKNNQVVEGFNYSTNPNSFSYDISTGGLNSAFKFGSLQAGTYRYVVKATSSSPITKTLIDASFSIIKESYLLSVVGQINGNSQNSLGECGTFEMWINDSLEKTGCTSYNQSHSTGTKYELWNINPKNGYSYNGIYSGQRKGNLNSDTQIVLDFSTINTSVIGNPKKTFTYNGNTYKYYTDSATWYTANQFCEEQGGHLLTIGSEEEHNKVFSEIGDIQIWTGGRKESGSWQWITFENFGRCTLWSPGEPNNSSSDEGGEYYLEANAAGWNDCAGCVKHGFVLEIESPDSTKLETDKNRYLTGEPIYVTANSIRDHAWVGLFKQGDQYKADTWLYWYYVSRYPGKPFDITSLTAAEDSRVSSLSAGDYSIALFGDITYDNVIKTVNITVEAPKNILNSEKTVYYVGDPIKVTADSNFELAWVGLFRSGDSYAPNTWINWYYVDRHPNECVDILSFQEHEELSAGSYSLVLFSDNGYTSIAKTLDITVKERSQLSVDSYRGILGDPINVTASSIDSGAWVGLFQKGATLNADNWIVWYNVKDHQGETINLLDCENQRLNRLTAGEYNLYVFRDQTYDKIDRFIEISIIEPSYLATNKTEYEIGEPVLVSARGYYADSWVGLYRKTDDYTNFRYLFWYYVSDYANESIDITKVAKQHSNLSQFGAGEYTVYLFEDNGFTVDKSVDISVLPPEQAGPTLSTDKTQYKPGEPIMVTVNYDASYAWVGLYGADEGYGPGTGSFFWAYVGNGVTFDITQQICNEERLEYFTTGNYVVRLFGDDGFDNLVATSNLSISEEPIHYTITYDANGGNGAPPAQTKTQGIDMTISSIVPTRSGYTFLGWAESNSATSAQYQPSGQFTKDADTTLYAVWEAKTYTISYDANGGSSAPAAQTKTHGVALTLSSTKPTRNGYSFLGWAESKNATSAQYQPSGQFTKDADTTLYAVWKANTYTVSYDANGGSGAPATQTKLHGVTLTLSATEPIRNGYMFLGWAETKTATNAQYQPSGQFTKDADTTLFAVWKIKTYTISYDDNGGSGAPASQTKTHGVALTLSSTKPTRSGYTFLGWAENSNATTAQYQPSGQFSKDADTTLYAVWKVKTYTITYNANGGSGAPATQTKTHGVALTLSSTRPTRSGYSFLGWAESSSATSAQYQPSGQFTKDTDTTLYAVWSEIAQYTITYNANGGTGAPAAQTKTHGVTLTLSSTKPTRSGYSFLGWAESSSATSAQYQPGGQFTKDVDTTLFAVWKANTYTITYNANGGTGAPVAQTKTHGVALTLSSTKPTRSGYTFLGWAESSGATSAQYQPGGQFTSDADTTLYAVWKAKTYTVTYDANGGSGAPATQTKTHGVALTLSSTKPTRSGYTFLGWAESSGATSAQYQPGGQFTTDADTTLYAVWKAKTYTVTYDAIGGSGAPAAQTKTHGVVLTLSTTEPVRNGYTFLGWAEDQAAVSAQYQPGGQFIKDANTTLYAVWQKNETPPTDSLTLIVGTTSGRPGSEVRVPVTLDQNPGIAYLRFTVSYDTSRLTLTSFENGVLGSWTGDVATRGFGWDDVKDSTLTGTVLTLVFTINADASEGVAAVTLTDTEALRFDETKVAVSAENGAVSIVTQRIPGDVTEDGVVDGADLLRLRKVLIGMNVEADLSAADVTGDSKVDGRDLLRLRKHLIGMDVELLCEDDDAELTGEGTLILSKPSNTLVPGDIFEIPVSLSGADGIAYLSFHVSYDKSCFKLAGYEEAGLSGWTADIGGTECFEWDDVQDTTINGIILTLRFEVLSNATEGLGNITVDQVEAFNFDEAEVALQIDQITAEVRQASLHEPVVANGELKAEIHAALPMNQLQVLVAAYDGSGHCLGVTTAVLEAGNEPGTYQAAAGTNFAAGATTYRVFVITADGMMPLTESKDAPA